ncbi:unnamed protein product [Lampetra fluviatilis]
MSIPPAYWELHQMHRLQGRPEHRRRCDGDAATVGGVASEEVTLLVVRLPGSRIITTSSWRDGARLVRALLGPATHDPSRGEKEPPTDGRPGRTSQPHGGRPSPLRGAGGARRSASRDGERERGDVGEGDVAEEPLTVSDLRVDEEAGVSPSSRPAPRRSVPEVRGRARADDGEEEAAVQHGTSPKRKAEGGEAHGEGGSGERRPPGKRGRPSVSASSRSRSRDAHVPAPVAPAPAATRTSLRPTSRQQQQQQSAAPAQREKRRHYDAEEVRCYMARRGAEQRRAAARDRAARRAASELRSRRLRELYVAQRQAAVAATATTAAATATTATATGGGGGGGNKKSDGSGGRRAPGGKDKVDLASTFTAAPLDHAARDHFLRRLLPEISEERPRRKQQEGDSRPPVTSSSPEDDEEDDDEEEDDDDEEDEEQGERDSAGDATSPLAGPAGAWRDAGEGVSSPGRRRATVAETASSSSPAIIGGQLARIAAIRAAAASLSLRVEEETRRLAGVGLLSPAAALARSVPAEPDGPGRGLGLEDLRTDFTDGARDGGPASPASPGDRFGARVREMLGAGGEHRRGGEAAPAFWTGGFPPDGHAVFVGDLPGSAVGPAGTSAAAPPSSYEERVAAIVRRLAGRSPGPAPLRQAASWSAALQRPGPSRPAGSSARAPHAVGTDAGLGVAGGSLGGGDDGGERLSILSDSPGSLSEGPLLSEGSCPTTTSGRRPGPGGGAGLGELARGSPNSAIAIYVRRHAAPAGLGPSAGAAPVVETGRGGGRDDADIADMEEQEVEQEVEQEESRGAESPGQRSVDAYDEDSFASSSGTACTSFGAAPAVTAPPSAPR